MKMHLQWLTAAMCVAMSTTWTVRADEPTPTPATTAAPAPTNTPQPTATPAPAASGATSPKGAPADWEEPKASRMYVDEDYDFKVAAPEGWYRTNPAQYGAAGELIRVWSPGSETAIMLYRVKPEEPHIPLTLLDQTAEATATKRKAAVIEQEVRKIAGMQAAWLVVSGPGNGGAIEGHGVISTVQHMVAIPREHDTVIFMLGTPEKDYPKYRPVYEKMIESLQMGGAQTEAQQASS